LVTAPAGRWARSFAGTLRDDPGAKRCAVVASEDSSLRVTWHGRGQRSHTFDIGGIGNGVTCSTNAHDLFLAILSLSFEPGASTILLP
jgi:hypothetical protein